MAEEGIYIVLALFLALAGVALIAGAGYGVYMDVSSHKDALTLTIDLLDEGLLLFMVAELLHTVRITVHERGLAAEPFLIVGLIAAIRRVLIVTAKSEQSFSWDSQGIELVVLAALIIVMAVAILVFRRSQGGPSVE